MSLKSDLKKLEIVPLSHPPHYMLHKYWGRKSHNLVSEYIKLFTKPGERVLDAFMGSGGVVIESNKLSRIGIGVDLNPMACFIVNETLKKQYDPEGMRFHFNEIVKSIPKEILDLTLTTDADNNTFLIDNAIWIDDNIQKIKYIKDGKRLIKEADERDIARIEKAKKLLKKYEKLGNTYPTDEIMQYVRRNGKKYIYELFSPRNLLIASIIINRIKAIEDISIKESLLLVFTSAMPNFSSMIPGDVDKVTGKSGWQISKFWVPGTHTEKNVIESLKLRLEKYIKGKDHIAPLLNNVEHSVHNQTSEDMSNIESGSIDYIFTDPPYGDSISYFALSAFWSSWLDHVVDYDGEIIYDPYRGKKDQDYSLRLVKSFKEMHRVLKNGKYLSFTFHNRQVKFWKIIIDAVMSAGFELIDVKWVDQAVASGTQGLNKDNTLTGDFVYTFRKVDRVSLKDKIVNGEDVIMDIAEGLIKQYGFVSTSKLYESLIPALVDKQAYYDSSNKILNIDKFIGMKYNYNLQESNEYGWTV